MALDSYIKKLLGFDPETDDEKVRNDWATRTKNVCKPCWELKYCPYGYLIEQFPPLSPTREEAAQHNEFLKKQLATGAYDKVKTEMFSRQVAEFDPNDYPISHNENELEKYCSIYGHICPVFFCNEPFTETGSIRLIGRHIPRVIMLRVVSAYSV